MTRGGVRGIAEESGREAPVSGIGEVTGTEGKGRKELAELVTLTGIVNLLRLASTAVVLP